MAANSLMIEASPLKLKQGTLLRTFRPLPSKPINLTTATFGYQLFSAPRFKNAKPPHHCYSLRAEKTTHCLAVESNADHPSLPQCLNVFKDNRPAAKNPNFVIKLWDKSLKALKKPTTAAVVLGLLIMYNPNSAALAAPVGRVGGSLTPTSNTTTLYNPSYHSSNIIETHHNEYYDPIWEWKLSMVLLVYFLGGCLVKSLPFFADLRVPLFIFWTGIMAIWFHSLGQTSVVKLQLQVNSSNTAQAMQMDLNRIAETANTCTHDGLRYVLRDTAVALLRQPDCCISGYKSEVIPKFSRAAAQHCFDKLVVRERVRYDEETIVNEDNIKSQSTASQRSTDGVVLVTILLAADGEHSQSLTITGSSDVKRLKRVLEELASINPKKRVLGVEVLWTPQLSSNAASNCIN